MAADAGKRSSVKSTALTLSVAMITFNEEANLARTLKSIPFANEIVVVDCGSTDRTAEIAAAYDASFFTEKWQGFGSQKNLALGKCTGDWVLSLDADEEVSAELAASIQDLLKTEPPRAAYFLSRRNYFLGRWMRHGGYYPDRKLRLIRRSAASFERRDVHETLKFIGATGRLHGDLVHWAYPTLHEYIEHMDRYSSLGAAHFLKKHPNMGLLSFITGVLMNPVLTFIYNYFFRLGFLDGKEGLLLHIYHSCYVSWKYAKAWESSRSNDLQENPGS